VGESLGGLEIILTLRLALVTATQRFGALIIEKNANESTQWRRMSLFHSSLKCYAPVVARCAKCGKKFTPYSCGSFRENGIKTE
jgi:hypothetical protein